MDLRELLSAFRQGTVSAPGAAAVALSALAACWLVTAGAILPLVRLLSRGDEERVQRGRSRRIGMALALGSVAASFFLLFHALLPVERRYPHLGYQLSEFILIAAGGYALVELLLAAFADAIPRWRGRPPASLITKDLLRTVLFLGIFLVAVKGAFPGTDIGALLTTSAILSIVVGLALQESLSNVFAGALLSVDRPFKPGDWIEVDGREGKVLGANWRSTRILTRDNDLIHIPNSAVAKGTLLNYSVPTTRHLCRRRVGVEYAAQPNKVRSVLGAMMASTEGVLKDPGPEVFVVDYGDHAVIYELRFWIEDVARRPAIEAEVLRGVWYHLKRHGLHIPFPVREVFLHRERPERRPEEVLDLLRGVDLLKPLQPAELDLLAHDLTRQVFARGESVFRQGEPGSTFYIIRSGRVAVLSHPEGGAEVRVAELKGGDHFGEMSLLTGEPRNSSCVAEEDSELLCLDRESFAELLRSNPPVAERMSEVLAARAQERLAKLASTRTDGAPETHVHENRARTILNRIRQMFRFLTPPAR
jgi:small-conductance mechanosensitive channel